MQHLPKRQGTVRGRPDEPHGATTLSAIQAGPRLALAVLAVTAALLLPGLGWLDADAPDEPRALQIAEEMRSFEHGARGLVLLHLNGEVYDQKPPLYYGLAAAFGAVGGRVTELAARLPSALAGLASVALVLVLGTRMLGGGTGVLAAAILATVFTFAHSARRVQLDVLLTAFELAALASFWWLDRGLGRPRRQQLLLHAALGLAVLTKGPVGFLLPTFTITAYLLWERRPRDLARVFPVWGLAISLLPAVAWLLAASALAPPGFLAGAVGENLFGRFFAGTSHARPFHYYFWNFPLGFLPWTLAWPVIWIVGRRTIFVNHGDGSARRAWRFLLAGIAVSLAFFSLSSGKRGVYLLPIFPATALLLADALLVWLSGRARAPRAFTIGASTVLVLLFVAGGLIVAAGLGHPVGAPAEVVAELRAPLLVAFGCGLIGIAFASIAAGVLGVRNRVPVITFPGFAAGTLAAVQLAVFLLLLPALEPVTSLRPTARAAAAITPEAGRIGLLGSRSMVGGIAYYGERRVAELRTPEDVDQFFAGGGRAVVLKAKKLDRLVGPVDVIHRVRSGNRALVVVTPRPKGPSEPGEASGTP
jgi:4-amino-4-deoxy-L-arabinose transferase-like glycosyltransferase